MILTLTLNPAVDISTTVDRLIPEQKLRCATPRYDAGGGGINVSKAIHRLGGSTLGLFPVGGPTGTLLEQLVAQQQIDYQTVPIAGWTRQSFVVSETGSQQQFRFGLPGPTWSNEEASQLLDTLQRFSRRVEYVVASGSLPPGLPADFFATLAQQAKKMGARLVLDTSGPPLQKAIYEGVFLLKPNVGELAALVGEEKLEGTEVEEAARAVVVGGGCEIMVVSLGPNGAVMMTKEMAKRCQRGLHMPAPTVKKQSTVGAGDSMVGGLVYALSQGQGYEDMLRLGVACGTAATMNPGTELFHLSDVQRLLSGMNCQPRLEPQHLLVAG
ncbi:6-phosphofructokinase 2 [Larkinella arboricola]|uniref:6-phosphofructokinase 2 n=1 Tax=Larkinella arboricola TaxID=643671 RepID=A0A327WNI8_LARAB|nr:1-phosphofructokinase family hexose kinase [Larkinella arboricola]RAJ89675.1 6-phosphofructokinase 2 [Larkinella arboricola]